MNPLIQGLFKQFRVDEELVDAKESDAFEHFAASLFLPEGLLQQVQMSELLLDQATTGVDVAILVVNGRLAWDADDVKDICQSAADIEVALHFIQAKQSEKVSGAEILNFGDTVRKILRNERFPEYPRLDALANGLGAVFDDYAGRLKGLPSAYLYFVTMATKKAIHSEPVRDRVTTVKEVLEGFGFLDKVSVAVLGGDDIHRAWGRKHHANEVKIRLEKQVNLPKMPGVHQAILGVVSAAELLKLIETGEEKHLDEQVFYDNVRGFLGVDNRVNGQIMGTLASTGRELLPVLNNGVTVVAASYTPGPENDVVVTNYQIVNGCQTSHCLHFSKEVLGDAISRVYVPIRLVVTPDEQVATQIIRATNSQTEVRENDLVALGKFQKMLADFYKVDTPNLKLRYERQSGQFYNKEVTKTRVVTISDQMRAVVAVFLDQPHIAARYPSKLYADIGDSIFREDHKLFPYMASAFAAYRLENCFRSGALDASYKPARYHILMALKYHVLGGKSASLEKRSIEKQSKQIIAALESFDPASTFREMAQVVVSTGGGELPSRDRLKGQLFTQTLITELMKS